MRPGAISPGPAPRPSAPLPGRPWTFRRALFWVVVGHAVLILAIAFWRVPAAKPAPGAIMEFTALPGVPPAGSASRAPEPMAAPPAPAPAPTPAPPVPPPTPPTPVEPPPEPTPAPPAEEAPEPPPSPAPSEIVLPPKPVSPAKPKKKTPPKTKPKAEAPTEAKPDDAPPATPPAPAPARRPKIDLTKEVNRSAVVGAPASKPGTTAGKGAKPNASKSEEGEGSGLTPSGVKSQLLKGLNGKGFDKPVIVGPPGGPSGGGGDGNQAYYDLIQKQMYGAWDQPSEFVGQHLRAKIRIHIDADGTISGAALAGSSGNAAFDASALGAARRAGRIPQPRPDDVPETVIVNFQLAE